MWFVHFFVITCVFWFLLRKHNAFACPTLPQTSLSSAQTAAMKTWGIYAKYDSLKPEQNRIIFL